MSIQVTADGHVHVGGNNWASLEKIQQAVLQKQNPTLAGLTANVSDGACPHCQQKQKQQISNNDEEHLPMPSTLQCKTERQAKSPVTGGNLKQIANAETEHLELPSTARR